MVFREVEEIIKSEYEQDELIWDGYTNGEITIKGAFDLCGEKSHTALWKKNLWRTF